MVLLNFCIVIVVFLGVYLNFGIIVLIVKKVFIVVVVFFFKLLLMFIGLFVIIVGFSCLWIMLYLFII